MARQWQIPTRPTAVLIHSTEGRFEPFVIPLVEDSRRINNTLAPRSDAAFERVEVL